MHLRAPVVLCWLQGCTSAKEIRHGQSKHAHPNSLFTGYYAIFLLGVTWTAPGYIERVWNLVALSGLSLAGVPVEELLFAAAFGAYWSSVYEHFTWRRLVPRGEARLKRDLAITRSIPR